MVFIPIFGIEFLKPFGFPKLRGEGGSLKVSFIMLIRCFMGSTYGQSTTWLESWNYRSGILTSGEEK